ncbi:UNVERIFIED_CONTAM: hypothetical protein HDU68_009676 [Siphonaria sp. JEL0065]|nr:hypothetical protein HDU68_009676 [Siphonaria sp. JEL0065]
MEKLALVLKSFFSKKSGIHPSSFKSILADIVDRWDHNMIVHPIFKSLIRVKWEVYVRRYFLSRFIWSFTTVLLFTISITLDSGNKTDVPTLTADVQYGLIVAAFIFTFWGIFDILEDYYSLYKKTHFLPRHLRRLNPPILYSLDERIEYMWNAVRRDIDEDLICLLFCISVIVSFSLSTAARFETEVDATTIAHIHGIGAVFGWIHILYYARGMRTAGPLILVLRQIIAKAVMRWIVIYLTIIIGFTAAFYAQMKNMDYEALGLADTPADWNTFGGSFLWTVRFLFVMDDFDNLRKVGGDFTMALFMFHQFIVIIVLLNVLIALLVDTFTSISTHYDSSWLLQVSRTENNADIDRDLTRHDELILGTHFGFHHNPVEIKVRRLRTKLGYPGNLSRAGSSLSTGGGTSSSAVLRPGSGANNGPLGNIDERRTSEYSESELPSIMGSLHSLHAVQEMSASVDVGEGSSSISDPRHFFLFLDRKEEAKEESGGKAVTKTVRLITGVMKCGDIVEDVEFVMDERYWSVGKVLWDLRHMYWHQSEDIWARVGKGL